MRATRTAAALRLALAVAMVTASRDADAQPSVGADTRATMTRLAGELQRLERYLGLTDELLRMQAFLGALRVQAGDQRRAAPSTRAPRSSTSTASRAPSARAAAGRRGTRRSGGPARWRRCAQPAPTTP